MNVITGAVAARSFILTDYLINGVIVVKRDKGEASFLASLPLSHDLHRLDGTILLEVLMQMIVFRVILDATNKDLLHREMSARPHGILGTRE